MPKSVLSLIALIGALFFCPANASSVAKVTAIESPVWVQHNDTKTRLAYGSELTIGDHVMTGESGRVELQLWSGVTLQLDTNAEIRIIAQQKTDSTDADDRPKLYIHQGKACLKNDYSSYSEPNFELNIGNALVAAIHRHGQICVRRQDSLSTVYLRDGSVQLTQLNDQSIVVLSEAGSEFRLDDEGFYELLFSETDESFSVENEATVVTEQEVIIENPDEAADTGAGDIAVVDGDESEPDAASDQSDFIYTVYLFSTRSESVAAQVNKKFQDAGHQTIILVSEQGSQRRYRVAMSGFKTRQSAQKFSNSIVGKLGVSGTWIGKGRLRTTNIQTQ